MTLDHSLSICPGDLEICCKPKEQKVAKNLTSVYKPRCGQHHPNGLGLRIENQVDGEFATQFGEWVHVCSINELGSEKLLGGASIIAPGVIITAAHKVE